MARTSNPILIYRKLKRKDRAALAFVYVAGKRHYLGEYGIPESREAYRRLVGEVNAFGARPPVPYEITVVEVAARFLDWVDGH